MGKILKFLIWNSRKTSVPMSIGDITILSIVSWSKIWTTENKEREKFFEKMIDIAEGSVILLVADKEVSL